MINTIKTNVINNLIKTFNKKTFDKLGSRTISALSAVAIINASAYSGYIGAQSQATIEELSLIHISEPTRQRRVWYAGFCL